MTALLVDRVLAPTPDPGRECGDCTACCTVLALVELRKPMRCACEHVGRAGCRIYADRPKDCCDFNCLWLRGALPAEVELRPDHLGVLFDGYRPAGSNDVRLAALEVWAGAFDTPAARGLIDAIAAEHRLELNFRDGTWATCSPTEDTDSCRPPRQCD
jgi:hypothetical protein